MVVDLVDYGLDWGLYISYYQKDEGMMMGAIIIRKCTYDYQFEKIIHTWNSLQLKYMFRLIILWKKCKFLKFVAIKVYV